MENKSDLNYSCAAHLIAIKGKRCVMRYFLLQGPRESPAQQFKHTNDATCVDQDYFLPLNGCPSADEHTAVRSRPVFMRN